MLVEAIKMVGMVLIVPVLLAYAIISIAKLYFEKDMKTRYLLAKEKAATDILNSLSAMLDSMWEMADIDMRIKKNNALKDDPGIIEQQQKARDNFHNAVRNSYLHLGATGLYYKSDIIDSIVQLQSELSNMALNNNFSVFDNWEEYRRNKVLPIFQGLNEDFKKVLFDKVKAFRLVSD